MQIEEVISTGTWETRNGEEVWVSNLCEEKSKINGRVGVRAIGCALKSFIHEGRVIQDCIELAWNSLGQNVDNMKEWDLVRKIEDVKTEVITDSGEINRVMKKMGLDKGKDVDFNDLAEDIFSLVERLELKGRNDI